MENDDAILTEDDADASSRLSGSVLRRHLSVPYM